MSQSAGRTGKVLAFEPLAYLREKFNRNILLNNAFNITLLPYALSDKESQADFAINPQSWNQGMFSLNNSAGGAVTQHVVIKVADDLDEIKALEKLDLVKIDVEGFEYHVLLGLAATLKKHKPRIIFEYDDNYWLRNGQSIADCFNFLHAFGYHMYQVTSAGCQLLSGASEAEGGNLFCLPQLEV